MILKGLNMKYVLLTLVIFSGLQQTAIAEETDEAKCKIFVEQTVKSLTDQARKYGEDIKLVDLSDENIMDIQNKKGSCAAMKEINIRLNSK